MTIKRLINYYKRITNARNKVYKVYFNNYTLLKMIHIMSLIFDQEKL